MFPTLPHRAHCVKNILCIQRKAGSHRHLTQSNAADLFAGLQQLWPGLLMDSRITAVPNDRLRVCRVDND